ncbi:MAG: hypothetical protein RBU30_15890, partial [Polyangia bacterium]|nr:hypothetical protein [Polyangia bacterium]
RRSTLLRLLRTRESRDVDLALLSMELAEPGHYGRIVREGGRVVRVVEYLDADEQTRRISEVNAGVYCIDIEFLRETLRSVGTVNVKGELYLTDLVAAASDRRGAIAIQVTPDEVRGVNTWTEQAELERIVRRREIARLMRNGVQVDEPETLIVESSVRVSTGCRLGPGVTLRAGTVIGRNCRIEQGSILDGCKLGQGAWIRPYCVLDGVKVPHGADIAPYTYLVGEERGYHSEINQSRRHETGRRTRQQHQMAAGSPSRERKK